MKQSDESQTRSPEGYQTSVVMGGARYAIHRTEIVHAC